MQRISTSSRRTNRPPEGAKSSASQSPRRYARLDFLAPGPRHKPESEDIQNDSTGDDEDHGAEHSHCRTIFVVHGHDAARTSEVTAFLEHSTKLRVVIMDKKAQLGRTLIEKFDK